MASRLRSLLELLRFSLAPTVVADLCGGAGLAHGGPGGGPVVLRLLPASLLLFCGGMALNAWVDREEDARARPQRPLPSGAVSPRFALCVALLGLCAAPPAAFALGGEQRAPCAAWAACLAALIAVYHTPVKRSALFGPPVLGAIRGGNLLLGAVGVAGAESALAAAGPAAAAYAACVLGASFVAHEEDRTPRMTLVRAGVTLSLAAVLVNGALAWRRAQDQGSQVAAVAAIATLWHLWSIRAALLLFARGAPRATPLAAFARLLLSRLPLLPAVAAFGAAAGDLGLIAIVAFWLVYALVRIIPPT
jgi:4-hydroxybenzoate polyprenyltransferase